MQIDWNKVQDYGKALSSEILGDKYKDMPATREAARRKPQIAATRESCCHTGTSRTADKSAVGGATGCTGTPAGNLPATQTAPVP